MPRPSPALLLALIALAPAAGALEVPHLDRRVMDRAGILSAPAQSRLERVLERYEHETGHQVVVHTTPSLQELPIEDYSIRIAEAWKVGHKNLDNGVILTVAPNERRVRIEVGYGLEGVIPDAIANRIIEGVILPAFREGGFERGIVVGVSEILKAASGEKVQVPRRDRPVAARGRGYGSLLWLLMLFLAFGSRGFFFLPFLMGGPRYRTGGFGRGGFGGGFGGGGGGFGGGGASGGW